MKQFFITFFANLAALIFVFGGPILLLMILIVASFSISTQSKRLLSIERGSILVFDLSVNVTDSPEHTDSTSVLDTALNGENNSVTLRHLTTAIEKAARDERIKALYLTGSFQPTTAPATPASTNCAKPSSTSSSRVRKSTPTWRPPRPAITTSPPPPATST
jgi:protease-4